MNKIVLLKIVIAIITFLIFLTLGGIVYAIINYKTTPKLLSRKTEKIFQTSPAKVPETYLGLKKGESIDDSHACGDLLCLKIKSDFEGNKIILFDPASLQIKGILIGGQKPEQN